MKRWCIRHADACDLPFKGKIADLVIGSPPYCDARDYGDGTVARKCAEWVRWMLDVTTEAQRVCRGPVVWVAAGVGNYQPAVEGLIWRLWKRGDRVLRPCVWTKNAPPTGKKWFSNEWEFVVAVGPVNYWNPSELATPIKYKSGGAFRQRGKDGKHRKGGQYPQHKMRKRPSNVFHVTVGGGHLGSPLAHKNEAPYPERLIEPFIRVLTPPGAVVLDPFCGSGTTAAVALRLGRRAFMCDIRASQCRLTKRRIQEVLGE